jgi:hypothetical protein
LIASVLPSDMMGRIASRWRASACSITARVPEPCSRKMNGRLESSRALIGFFLLASGSLGGAMTTSSSFMNTDTDSSGFSARPSVRPNWIE